MRRSVSVLFAVALALVLLAPAPARAAAARADEALVEDLCRQMEAAYESLEPGAVVALYHDLGPRGVKLLNRLFERSNSVSVELEFKEMDPTNTEAVVLMTHISLVHKWCRRKLEARPYQEYHLKKIDGVWKFVRNTR